MSLPKLDHITFEFQIPSTKAKVKMRPMRVKEEKVLLTAKESKDSTDILRAIKQIINNCMESPNVDIDQLALFDVEFIFLRLRAASVDNMAKVSYKDGQDDKVYDFEVDLNSVTVKFPEQQKNIIPVNATISLELGFPTAAIYSDQELFKADTARIFDLLVSKCIKKIHDGDKQYDLVNSTPDEVNEFIDSMDIKVYDQVKEFFANMPQLEHTIKYKNSLGNDRVIRLSTLDDFFILG